MAIPIVLGFPITWLADVLAPPRLDFDTGLILGIVCSLLAVGAAGFVVRRISSMRAVWVYAIVQFIYSVWGAVQFWQVLRVDFAIAVAVLGVLCAALGGILSNRLVAGRIRRSPLD